MTAGDRKSWKDSGARLTETHEQVADWRWKIRKLVKGGVKHVAATNGAVVHDNSYRYTTYITNNTADIVLQVLNGTVPGEKITIKLHTLDTNDVVVTPDTFHDGSTITLDTTNDECTLFWSGATDGWMVQSSTGTLA